MKGLDTLQTDYQKIKIELKQTLQCFTPSALLESKKRDAIKIIHRNPILQLDFDNPGDIEEIKAAIYDLPFVCYCGKSISGYGLFALIQIDERERLEAYAEHCFRVFESYGIAIDTSKGRNYTDLRFVSYDADMLYRDDPIPLRIKRFNAPKIISKPSVAHGSTKKFSSNSGLINWAIQQIQNAQIGQRFEIVRKVSFAMGGRGLGLDEIKQAINYSSQFAGVESKYLRHADEGYMAGKLKTIAA